MECHKESFDRQVALNAHTFDTKVLAELSQDACQRLGTELTENKLDQENVMCAMGLCVEGLHTA